MPLAEAPSIETKQRQAIGSGDTKLINQAEFPTLSDKNDAITQQEKSAEQMSVAERVEKARKMTGIKIIQLFHVTEIMELQAALTREDMETARWRIDTTDAGVKHVLRTTSLHFVSTDPEKEGADLLAKPKKGGLKDLETRLSRVKFDREKGEYQKVNVHLPAADTPGFNWKAFEELKELYGARMNIIPHEKKQEKSEPKNKGNMADLEARLATLQPGQKLKIKLPEPAKAKERWQEIIEIKQRFMDRVELIPAEGSRLEDYASSQALERTDEMPALQMHMPEEHAEVMTKVDYLRLIDSDNARLQGILGKPFTLVAGSMIEVRLQGPMTPSQYFKCLDTIAQNAPLLGQRYNIQAVRMTVNEHGRSREELVRLAPPKQLTREAEQVSLPLANMNKKLGGAGVTYVSPSTRPA